MSCIFNIQKFSLHDGPGIRTVVFYKGCPLSCKWCANPESQNINIEITYEKNKCILCNKCLNICPTKAISKKDNRIIIDKNKCIACLKCVNVCPKKALKNEGDFKSIKEIMNEILKDKDFYEESNGGVTLSGGEVLYQYKNACELILECKKNNIHVAIETTGYGSLEDFSNLIENVDLILFDIKHYNKYKHFEGTGVYNDIIIENLKFAVKENKKIICRIPVIPEFNDSLEDALNFSKLLKSINIKEVNLLPFHQFGLNKYKLLNKVYSLENIKELTPSDLEEYKEIFLSQGLNCYF